jgi:hypothetical protein
MKFWSKIETRVLAQGDHLPGCFVPILPADFSETVAVGGETQRVPVSVVNLMVMTQSCDLENNKAPFVACCPIHTLLEFEAENPGFNNSRWEQVRIGRVEGLHLLAGFTAPESNRDALVVNFRQIFSLPIEYLSSRASAMGPRWRLDSPYLEHFSQAFARFFMRVGLPSSIPSYTAKK